MQEVEFAGRPDRGEPVDNVGDMRVLSVNNRYINSLFPLIALGFIVFRDFDLIIHPRFWAEEGSVYFLDAYVNGFEALFHPHQGYFSIVPNVATYLATFVSLENAPVVTTVFSLFIHFIPFVLICTSDSRLLDTSLKKFIFSSVVLFICHTGEISLNVITSQFHFVVIVFLVLLESKESIGKLKERFLYALVMVSGLSGVPGNILAPAFLYDYLKNNNRTSRNIFFILILTTLIQVIYIFVITSNHLNRFDQPEIRVFTDIVANFLNYPIFYQSKYLPLIIRMLLVAPLFFTIIHIVRRNKFYILFFGSSLFLNIVMMFSSLDMHGGARYVYAPSVIFIFGLITILSDRSFSKPIKTIVLIYVIVAFGNSIWLYPAEEGRFNSTKWKKWEDQVRLYEGHVIDELVIYPQWNNEFWKIDLPRK